MLDFDKKNVIVFITDVRYLNELEWVHASGGKGVFISRTGIKDANDEERANNKILKDLCCCKVSWPTVGNDELESLIPTVQSTLELLLPCSTKNLFPKSKKTKMSLRI